MQKVKSLLVALALAVAGTAGVAMPVGLAAAATDCPNGNGTYEHSVAECGINEVGGATTEGNDLMSRVKTIINVVLGVVGVVAVVIIIIAGVYFILSQGDAAKITRAKNTIIYGVVGLLVALLAFAIVNFVLSSVF